jgi:hypothetical protein
MKNKRIMVAAASSRKGRNIFVRGAGRNGLAPAFEFLRLAFMIVPASGRAMRKSKVQIRSMDKFHRDQIRET